MPLSGKVLVTGATGFIGSRLVEALVARGCAVRALSRRPGLRPDPPPGLGWDGGGPLADPHVEWVAGDITDRPSLERAAQGCTGVFHLAAYAKNWAPDRRTFHQMNVEGMRNVFDAAEKAGARRVVWTSSIVTFGPTPRGQVGSEAMPRITDRYFNDYEETKTAAEREALERATAGFPVVIVNPTRVFGPGYLTEGNTVTLLIDDYDRGRMPVLLNRGVNVGNWVLVDDVVQGQLLAMQRGRVGQRYILGGENASLGELFRMIDRISGRRHLKIPVFRYTALIFAGIQKKIADWFGVYPRITPGWVRMFLAESAYSTEKAQRELGYRPTPLYDGLERTYAWIQRVRKERS
jgi:farnesol dehydrogenase